jgi:hypothetical protein
MIRESEWRMNVLALAAMCAGLGGTQLNAQTGIFINGRELGQEQVVGMARLYGSAAIPGRYWYDSRSGLYGFEGREAIGFILPGHDFGPLARNASGDRTGIFINGAALTEQITYYG